jgi:hypothetical protein
MTSQRPLLRVLRLTLIALVLAGFESVYSTPKSGDWKVVTDFGQFIITVSAGGSSITKIAYTFVSFKCGGVGTTISGGMTVTSSWSITNNKFTITTDLNSNPFGTPWPHTINGTFSATGEQASGTWSASVAGVACSGSWGPVGPATSVEDESGLPKQFALEQNYPNPFNPSTTIKYELPKSSEIRLSVFDILGREVPVLVNERREAGVHEVKFDGSSFASGVYFYRLQAGDFVSTKRMLILK